MQRQRSSPAGVGSHGEVAEASCSSPLYRRLRPGPHGDERDHLQVLADQRARLQAAMIEAAAHHGYPAVSVRRLIALAGVSKRSFYEIFSCKQECFLATFDRAVEERMMRMHAACAAGSGFEARLQAFFEHALLDVVEHPKEARLRVVEALALGDAACTRIDDAHARMRRLLASILQEAPEGLSPPPFAVRGVVHGVWLLLCLALLDQDAQQRPALVVQLPELAGDLCAWTLSYLCEQAPSPVLRRVSPHATPRHAGPPSGVRPPLSGDPRNRLRRAAVEIVGRHGNAELDRRSLLALAGVELETYSALYGEVEECFMDALDLLAAETLAPMLTAARSAGSDWPAAVRAAIAALLAELGRDPMLARVVTVEALCAGQGPLMRGGSLLRRFAQLIRRHAPPPGPSQPVSEAIVGAVWGTIGDHAAAGATDRLPQLADHLAFLVLAPCIGAQAAIEAIATPPGDAALSA